jgi:ribosomal protein L40E
VNGFRLECRRCEASWELGQHVSHFERQTHEATPCHRCGSLTLRCREVVAGTKRNHRRARLVPISADAMA